MSRTNVVKKNEFRICTTFNSKNDKTCNGQFEKKRKAQSLTSSADFEKTEWFFSILFASWKGRRNYSLDFFLIIFRFQNYRRESSNVV